MEFEHMHLSQTEDLSTEKWCDTSQMLSDVDNVVLFWFGLTIIPSVVIIDDWFTWFAAFWMTVTLRPIIKTELASVSRCSKSHHSFETAKTTFHRQILPTKAIVMQSFFCGERRRGKFCA